MICWIPCTVSIVLVSVSFTCNNTMQQNTCITVYFNDFTVHDNYMQANWQVNITLHMQLISAPV